MKDWVICRLLVKDRGCGAFVAARSLVLCHIAENAQSKISCEKDDRGKMEHKHLGMCLHLM